MADNLQEALSWLDAASPTEKQRTEMPAAPANYAGAIDYTNKKENAPTEALEGLAGLQRKIDQRQAEKATIAAIYKRYNDNIKAANALETEILKGLDAGQNIYKLFLMAAKALSATINDTGFYDMIENKVLAIYGSGLQEPGALELEAGQTRERLEKLIAAAARAENEDDRQRIQKAIASHREAIKKLEAAIRKAG